MKSFSREVRVQDAKRKRFESTVAALQQRHGTQVLVPARAAAAQPAAIPTGFAALDALLGIGGLPLGALTLLGGPATSGKLTLAYKVLSHSQWPPAAARVQRLRAVAIVDTGGSSDPDYLERAGIHLDYLLLVRPQSGRQAVDVLIDLVRSRQARAILLDSLAGLLQEREAARYIAAMLPQLQLLLSQVRCAVILIDEAQPAWLRWTRRLAGSPLASHAALHLELQRERWLERGGELCGYQAQVHIRRNRWGRSGQSAPIAIEFNGIVRARETW